MKKFIIFILLLKYSFYLPDYYTCVINNTEKTDCAFTGPVTEEDCINQDCCYQQLEEGSITPWCYLPKLMPTTIITTILTTILSTIPTTIITTIPKTVPITLPKTLITNSLSNFTIFDYFEKIIISNNDSNKGKDDIINDIITLFENNENNLVKDYIKEEKKDFISKNDNITCQITSSYNQKNNYYENISTIDLGECENILKKKYNISPNDTIIILKFDYNFPDYSIPIIEYQLYHPEKNIKLNLSYCENTDIQISILVIINKEDLFKYDPNNSYYTDKCYSYTTENGTDITLYDRKNEFNNNNFSLCEKNCQFNE